MVNSAIVDRFIEDLKGLTIEQWLEICRRHAAAKRAITVADEDASAVLADLATGRLAREERSERTKLAKDAMMRHRAITALLPESQSANGKPFPLQSSAREAVRHAMQALLAHEHLLAQGGKNIVDTLTAPFRGLTALPQS